MSVSMAWLWFVDTSHHTDYLLILAVDCLVGAMVLVTALAAGLGLAVVGLAVLLVALLATTWYARMLGKREQTRKAAGAARAFKIRPAR